MPTNEERREVAKKIRELTEDVWSLAREWEEEGIFTNGQDQADYYQIYLAIFGTLPAEHMHPCDYDELHERLADLIEPDYTSEESGYFILPKPREPLVIQNNPINGSLYEIINENVREWQKQIEEDIQQRLFETFRKTCKNVGCQMTCSECGAHVYGAIYEHSFVNKNGKRIYTTANEPKWNYCPNCGAKVVEL